jgi:hypothetical protein
MILALMRPPMRTPSEGAVAVVWVATPPELANVSGKLFGSREFSLPAGTRDPDRRRHLKELPSNWSGLNREGQRLRTRLAHRRPGTAHSMAAQIPIPRTDGASMTRRTVA